MFNSKKFLGICLLLTTITKADITPRLEVVCPPFEKEGNSDNVIKTVPRLRNSNNDYCQCSLTEHGSSKTAILKCEFNFEEDIILKGNLFPFGKYNVTSAYVRMRNARSAVISGEFLTSWMDAPSSALDLWHCGKVVIEPTPHPHSLQLFKDLKTFVGVGIIDCTIETLPSLFLRDRKRAAFRLKGCTVDRINAGILHNIEEIRYMNFEDTIVKEVAGPLSSSGVITLSKKEIHSWDGIEFTNSTFTYIGPFAFNVTHKNEMEKFNIERCTFGKLEKGAISATGDINVVITNSSFEQLKSLAIKLSVTGKLSFTSNVIKSYVSDSLLGITCAKDSSLNNNTFYVASQNGDSGKSQFTKECGSPKVSYIIAAQQVQRDNGSVTSTVVAIFVLLVAVAAVAGFYWAWKNRILLRFHYRRRDTPLWRDERAPDGEEDTTSPESTSSSVLHNPVFNNTKLDP